MSELFRRSDQALSADVGEDVVALQQARGFAYGMEGVSASVWQRLATPTSLDQLVAAMREEYEVDEAECRRDLEALIAQLLDEGLIVRVAQ